MRLLLFFSSARELAELSGSPQSSSSPIVSSSSGESRFEAGADDVVPPRLELPLALAQDVGVVDLRDFQMALAGRGPQPPDAAGRPHLVVGLGEQVEEGQPPLWRRARVQREHANHVAMEQRAGFANRLVGPVEPAPPAAGSRA